MILRPGTIDEMLSLWYKFYTSDFFQDSIQKGNAEFWTIDDHGSLIAELYIFKHLDDHDFADGDSTAYLYGFRVAENKQRKGFGTMLLNRVLQRLRELNFTYATIGVEPGEEANVRLYTTMGFTQKVKTVSENPCDVNENQMPIKGSKYVLLRKTL